MSPGERYTSMGNIGIVPFSTLKGLTLISAEYDIRDDRLNFVTTEGRRFRQEHIQECCENVFVEDICGELEHLIGSPILHAEEVDHTDDEHADGTWTFYHLRTAKGDVTIRWYGTSSGYYSEDADLYELSRKIGG